MEDLAIHRKAIDEIDSHILKLLNERAGHVLAIGEIKKEKGSPVWVPEREQAIYDRLAELNTGKFPNWAVRKVYREIISASIALEQPVKIGYFGLPGTFANMAAIKRFGTSADLVPMGGIRDVFDGVEKNRVKYGIIPIENTIEGIVNHSIDMFMDTPLFISGEIFVEISQNLLNKTGGKGDIKHIYSHPHALAQCRNWLYKNMPDIPVSPCESTAKAAEMASKDSSVGAVASEIAETLYGLKIIEKHIEDETLNYTRFLILSREEMPPTGKDMTSVMFGTGHEAGDLCTALEILKKGGVNMTRLESRPSKQKAWEYLFYTDIEGHKNDPPIMEVLDKFGKTVNFLKILGSYPRGEH